MPAFALLTLAYMVLVTGSIYLYSCYDDEWGTYALLLLSALCVIFAIAWPTYIRVHETNQRVEQMYLEMDRQWGIEDQSEQGAFECK